MTFAEAGACVAPMLAWLVCLAGSTSEATGADTVVVKPQEIDDVLVNPGMGWTTFHSFQGDPQNANYPASSIAYFRWYWDQLEPEQGHVRWELIDDAMKTAHERGQTLAFRFMSTDGTQKTPQWLRDLGCKGMEFNDGRSWQPDYGDPLYLQYMGRLVREAGERYDGHPDLDHVDIGSLGRWGEWHTSGTGMEMPPFAVKKQIIDMYLNAFRKTPLVALIGDLEGLRYAVQQGTGWRADCLGDMGGFSQNWNHMQFYPEQLQKAEATEAWKQAPVCFETCWTMQFWHDKGWDVNFIFQEALKMHVSVVNNKSSAVPQDWWPAVNDFSRHMGYRLVLRELEHPQRLQPTEAFDLRMLWENVGVAPCYHPHPLDVQLRSGEDRPVWQTRTNADLMTWLPGKHEVREHFDLPANVPPGRYQLRLAFLDPNTARPDVKLAIAGIEPDGWYRVSDVEVAAR
jgi:hypothetical protein